MATLEILIGVYTIAGRNSDIAFLYIMVTLDYTWLMFYFPQGGSGVPCPPLFASVAPSFTISGHDLLLVGDIFSDSV